MGGRLSVPKSADALSETSRPARGSFTVNARTLTMPLAAFTMAGLLFFYARTSIRAAKINAQKHREADGGQFSWANESRRRHGMANKIGDDSQLVRQALMSEVDRSKKPFKPSPGDEAERRKTEHEAELNRRLGKE